MVEYYEKAGNGALMALAHYAVEARDAGLPVDAWMPIAEKLASRLNEGVALAALPGAEVTVWDASDIVSSKLFLIKLGIVSPVVPLPLIALSSLEPLLVASVSRLGQTAKKADGGVWAEGATLAASAVVVAPTVWARLRGWLSSAATVIGTAVAVGLPVAIGVGAVTEAANVGRMLAWGIGALILYRVISRSRSS